MSTEQKTEPKTHSKHTDFLRAIINEHLESNKYNGKVVTRFPPEPNGFLHIGHAKSICLNFGIANDYEGAKCHLRLDDTDPTKEDISYVNSIQEDVKWLGFDWGENIFFASDYFEDIYQWAIKLIEMGKAYVCELKDDEIKEYRGTVTEPGKDSPYKNRSIEENLDLFKRMKAGEFKDGERVLRAKIDMTSPNMKMRDPLLYRIRHANHYRKGEEWCIYPMYDFAHCLSDYKEKITHSICTLEFENNRELYDWILDELELEPPRPYQYEFARLNLNYTVMSKRRLLELVEGNHVNGWDDPRLPTISGIRRRGYTPESIRKFCESIGIAKANSTVDMAQLEYTIRNDLNPKVPRVLCVLNPLKVIIDNYPDDKKEELLDSPYYPHDVPKEGKRKVPFSKVIYIEHDDFMEHPPKRYHRLSPNGEVRLRHAYIIKCNNIVKNKETGEITELHCSYFPDTKSGEDDSGKKVKGTIHWVSEAKAVKAEVRLYDRLFTEENPDGDPANLNPDSLKILDNCLIEPDIVNFKPGDRFQFERQGYFYMDPISTTKDKMVFNRIVQLRDSWAKITTPQEEKRNKPSKKKSHQKQQQDNNASPEITEMTPEIEARITNYKENYNLSNDDAIILARESEIATFFESSLKAYNNPVSIAKWIINELLRELKEKTVNDLAFSPLELAELVKLIDNQTISGKIAKDVFNEMLENGGNPSDIVNQKGLKQITNTDELEPIIEAIIKNNPENVEKYKSGRTNLLGFFVGQAMKETKGQANPELLNKIILEKLS